MEGAGGMDSTSSKDLLDQCAQSPRRQDGDGAGASTGAGACDGRGTGDADSDNGRAGAAVGAGDSGGDRDGCGTKSGAAEAPPGLVDDHQNGNWYRYRERE